jgi:hypothetical protein
MDRISSTPPIVVLVACLSGVVPHPALAQARVYQSNLADEDWSFLKDASKRQDWWDPAKYVPFGRDDWFMTLSGEIRYRPEGFRIKASDIAAATRDQYLLQRYLFGADFHFGNQVRMYAEIQSGIINGRIGASRPTDENRVDLHQGFVEWKSSGDAAPGFAVSAGRQELTIGNSRLISAAPGLNVKRSFDGVRAAAAIRLWRFETAAAELTDLKSGAFDDVPEHQIRAWGLSARRAGPGWKRAWTIYYLGLVNKDFQLAQGRGKDTRHTIGLNYRGSHGVLDFNYDGIVQAGTFQGSEARAWGISTETGFRLAAARWRPRFGLRANAASGDRDPADPTVQSFNPLFPGASFAGPIGLFGPTNMIDATPFVSVIPRRGLVVGFERPWYWRQSTGDGVYNTALRLLVPPTAGTGTFIGGSSGILAVWQTTTHFQLSGAIIRLVPGRFLDATFVKGGAGLYSVTATYRF